jgi:catalase
MKTPRPSTHRAGLSPLVLAAVGAVATPLTRADEPAHETPASMVGALHSAFGEHHARAVHAKGVVLEGTFTPAPKARTLTSAALFSSGTIPVTIRFSDFTGLPDIPDSSPNANPRGFAIKFHLLDGSEADIVTHSFNGFPVSSADEFATFLRAVGSSGPDAPKPAPIDAFLDSHPVAKTFLTTQKPPPLSYATAAYFGVNSFAFTDGTGHRIFVRYRFMPVGGEHYLDATTVANKGPDYLIEEIGPRVAKSPAKFEWFAQISEKGDAIEDPSIAWPETRHLVLLGTISIVREADNQAAAQKSLLFLPARVPKGIETADPMLNIRHASYPISFAERQ